MTSIVTRLALVAGLLAVTLGAGTPTTAPQDATPTVERQGAPYLLAVCAVSGEPLPADGGRVLVFDGGGDAAQAGREFRFCCDKCVAASKKDPKRFIPDVDRRIIEDQLPRYPKSAGCLVMTEEMLPDPTGPEAKDCKLVVVRNRLVRLCCGKCVRAFERDPAKFLPRLDEIVIADAKAGGRITTCVVNDRDLPKTATWFVIGDRAVATCCGNCRKKVEADPRTYLDTSKTTKKSQS